MTFEDCLTVAAQTALNLDVPASLLPLTISNQAALWAGFDADGTAPDSWR